MEENKVELHRVTRIYNEEISPEQVLVENLGNAYMEYRETWEKSFDKNHKIQNFPVHLDFELQDFCNQACKMCPRDTSRHPNLLYQLGTNTVGSTSMFKDAISQGAKRGLKSVNFGAFSEPLIHKGLWDLIAFAHENGIIDSRVITNGLLLDRYTENIFESGLVNLFISIDASSRETYEKIRGKGFERVIRNVDEILRVRAERNLKLPIIRVSFVEMDLNAHEKESFLNYWLDKVDHVDIQKWSDYTRVANNQQRVEDKVFNCRSPWQRLSILANGDILPCCDFNGRNLVIGNAKTDRLEEVWSSKEMSKIREEIEADSSPICSSCQRCFGS